MFTWDESDKAAAKRNIRHQRELQRTVLRLYGLKPWDIGAPVPRRIRVWRRLRRRKVIDWRSYNAAEAEYWAEQAAFEAEIPGRAQDIADRLSEGLPDGMRFEWRASDER
jgi:hypothetical protein